MVPASLHDVPSRIARAMDKDECWDFNIFELEAVTHRRWARGALSRQSTLPRPCLCRESPGVWVLQSQALVPGEGGSGKTGRAAGVPVSPGAWASTRGLEGSQGSGLLKAADSGKVKLSKELTAPHGSVFS